MANNIAFTPSCRQISALTKNSFSLSQRERARVRENCVIIPQLQHIPRSPSAKSLLHIHLHDPVTSIITEQHRIRALESEEFAVGRHLRSFCFETQEGRGVLGHR